MSTPFADLVIRRNDYGPGVYDNGEEQIHGARDGQDGSDSGITPGHDEDWEVLDVQEVTARRFPCLR